MNLRRISKPKVTAENKGKIIFFSIDFSLPEIITAQEFT